MRLRRAVPKIPPKSSVAPGLPVYKNRSALTHSESTLPQVLIPLDFNSPRINTYKKPGRGSLPNLQYFANSSLRPAPSFRAQQSQIPIPSEGFSISARPSLCNSAHQCHFKMLTLPLFSYSCALFCTLRSVNSFPVNHFRTLSPKHPGGVVPLFNATLFSALKLPSGRLLAGTFRYLDTPFFRCFILVLPSPPHPGAVHA